MSQANASISPYEPFFISVCNLKWGHILAITFEVADVCCIHNVNRVQTLTAMTNL